ncbi:MAG: RnfABCDGE type electron transport complex subunit C, partial [Elusimicrobiota bacterium]
ISVVKLKTKYPQGAERQLVYSILRRVVPAGEIPISVGVVVNNVGTAAAIDELFRTGMPLIKRVVTVTGRGVRNPKNLEVKIGTTFADLIEECGGLLEGAARVIAGGPMMGISQHTLEVPVVKGCTGILVLKEDEIDMSVPGPCIRCGKCIEVCPLGLSPAEMGLLAENQKWDAPEIKQAIDCMECGLCAYVCPSKRPLVQFTKLIKSQIKK